MKKVIRENILTAYSLHDMNIIVRGHVISKFDP